jgi:hypothetical protein
MLCNDERLTERGGCAAAGDVAENMVIVPFGEWTCLLTLRKDYGTVPAASHLNDGIDDPMEGSHNDGPALPSPAGVASVSLY